MALSHQRDFGPSRRGDPCGPIEVLIAEAREGSTAALGRLLEAFRKYLLLAANSDLDSHLRPKAGASDLVQETFCEAQRDFDQFRGLTEQELVAWLKGILTHRLANHVRHYGTRMRDVQLEVPLDLDTHRALEALGTPASVFAKRKGARHDETRLYMALARLSALQRRVVERRTWQRAPFAEIGAEMGITADAARKHWSRAVQRLQQELRDNDDS